MSGEILTVQITGHSDRGTGEGKYAERRDLQLPGLIVEKLLIWAIAGVFGKSRQDLLNVIADAGLQDASVTRRVGWMLRGIQGLLAGAVERRAGRLFDQYVGEYWYRGLRFAVPPELTTLEERGRFLLRRYERPECRLSRKFIPRDATVLELGGCLGVVACMVNRRLADPRRHVVLEPHPLILPLLEANRSRNGCDFTVRQQIIANTNGVTFYLRDPYIAGSSTMRTSDRHVVVPTTTIGKLESETGLSFDTLLVDIEGGEHALFIENESLLGRVRAVIVEMHPHIIGDECCAEIRRLFRNAGLTYRQKAGSVEVWIRCK